MNQLNSVLIEGNIVRNAELRTVAGNKRICSLNIAVNRYLVKGDEPFAQDTSYFDVDSWGKLAELASELAVKGRGVRIVGKLVQERWKDKDGKNCSKVKILAEHIEFKPIAEKPVLSEPTNSEARQQKTESYEVTF